jgi:hypothetical protein
MWADTGRRRSLVELKAVIATTEASRSIIEDSDTRSIQSYDRAIFPAYPRAAISHAFAIERLPGAVPFGFEYITSCRFRDLNFGPREEASIGGEHSSSARSAASFRADGGPRRGKQAITLHAAGSPSRKSPPSMKPRSICIGPFCPRRCGSSFP